MTNLVNFSSDSLHGFDVNKAVETIISVIDEDGLRDASYMTDYFNNVLENLDEEYEETRQRYIEDCQNFYASTQLNGFSMMLNDNEKSIVHSSSTATTLDDSITNIATKIAGIGHDLEKISLPRQRLIETKDVLTILVDIIENENNLDNEDTFILINSTIEINDQLPSCAAAPSSTNSDDEMNERNCRLWVKLYSISSDINMDRYQFVKKYIEKKYVEMKLNVKKQFEENLLNKTNINRLNSISRMLISFYSYQQFIQFVILQYLIYYRAGGGMSNGKTSSEIINITKLVQVAEDSQKLLNQIYPDVNEKTTEKIVKEIYQQSFRRYTIDLIERMKVSGNGKIVVVEEEEDGEEKNNERNSFNSLEFLKDNCELIQRFHEELINVRVINDYQFVNRFYVELMESNETLINRYVFNEMKNFQYSLQFILIKFYSNESKRFRHLENISNQLMKKYQSINKLIKINESNDNLINVDDLSTLLSVNTVKQFFNVLYRTIKRMNNVLFVQMTSWREKIEENVIQLYHYLLKFLFDEFLYFIFDLITQNLPSQNLLNNRSQQLALNSEDVLFTNGVNLDMLHAIHRIEIIVLKLNLITNAFILPNIYSSKSKNIILSEKLKFIRSIEQRLIDGQEKYLSACISYLQLILTQKQKKTDYKPVQNGLEMKESTVACQFTSKVISEQIKRIKSILFRLTSEQANEEHRYIDEINRLNITNRYKGNISKISINDRVEKTQVDLVSIDAQRKLPIEQFEFQHPILMEYGLRLHRIIYDHICRFEYNELGGMMVLFDVKIYRDVLKSCNSLVVDQVFNTLYSLTNLLIVAPINVQMILANNGVAQITNDEDDDDSNAILATLNRNIIQMMVNLREDKGA
ncbi:hypothetical protein SNEBB_011330 [Seison nebaliae]|nr:hypothetical protein SNEBB_011330 [Seison nebaliae]